MYVKEKFTKIGYYHLAFLIYLLDQIRFIPEPKGRPWETELTAPLEKEEA